MKKEVFANFNRYNTKGERMNVFAYCDDDRLYITHFPCSVKDQFCKKTARELYWKYILSIGTTTGRCFKANKIEVPIVDNKPKKTFLNWCNENFFRLESRVDWRNHYVEYLKIKNNKILILRDKPVVTKLSMKY